MVPDFLYYRIFSLNFPMCDFVSRQKEIAKSWKYMIEHHHEMKIVVISWIKSCTKLDENL